MTSRKRSSELIITMELLAQLENDPEFQRKRQQEEAERQEARRELTRAEQPIVADLRSAGFDVDSVWDLGNRTGHPNPAALPVLLKHLQLGGYPDFVMASLGHLLAMKEANFAWDTLREHYLKAHGPAEQTGLVRCPPMCAVASGSARPSSKAEEEPVAELRATRTTKPGGRRRLAQPVDVGGQRTRLRSARSVARRRRIARWTEVSCWRSAATHH